LAFAAFSFFSEVLIAAVGRDAALTGRTDAAERALRGFALGRSEGELRKRSSFMPDNGKGHGQIKKPVFN
jgi:hypothetical protein